MKNNNELRAMTKSAYDIQNLRIASGLRLVAQLKTKLGQKPSLSESTLDDRSKLLLTKIRANFKLVTDGAIPELEDPRNLTDDKVEDNQFGVTESKDEKKKKAEAGLISELLEINYRKLVAENKAILSEDDEEEDDKKEDKGKKISSSYSDLPKPKKFKGNPIISEYGELCLIQHYKELLKQEENQFKRLAILLKDFPVFNEYLKGVKGIGPAMASVIISELNIETANYPSAFHMYAGLDVGPDGRGRSRRANHLIKREYINKDGELDTRDSITFNPFVKTKLMGVLSGSFLRAGNNPYSQIYKDYKFRITNRNEANGEKKTKAHIHWMALRYMIKIFLIDLWCNWRVIEGLPIRAPYHVAKLGYSDHGLLAHLKEKYAGKYEVTVQRGDHLDSWDISDYPDDPWGVIRPPSTK